MPLYVMYYFLLCYALGSVDSRGPRIIKGHETVGHYYFQSVLPVGDGTSDAIMMRQTHHSRVPLGQDLDHPAFGSHRDMQLIMCRF